jgi:hypothetical protein
MMSDMATTNENRDEVRKHLAWLMWCYSEGYVTNEDREILTNWMDYPSNRLHPDDVKTRDGLLSMAGEILDQL